MLCIVKVVVGKAKELSSRDSADSIYNSIAKQMSKRVFLCDYISKSSQGKYCQNLKSYPTDSTQEEIKKRLNVALIINTGFRSVGSKVPLNVQAVCSLFCFLSEAAQAEESAIEVRTNSDAETHANSLFSDVGETKLIILGSWADTRRFG